MVTAARMVTEAHLLQVPAIAVELFYEAQRLHLNKPVSGSPKRTDEDKVRALFVSGVTFREWKEGLRWLFSTSAGVEMVDGYGIGDITGLVNAWSVVQIRVDKHIDWLQPSGFGGGRSERRVPVERRGLEDQDRIQAAGERLADLDGYRIERSISGHDETISEGNTQ